MTMMTMPLKRNLIWWKYKIGILKQIQMNLDPTAGTREEERQRVRFEY